MTPLTSAGKLRMAANMLCEVINDQTRLIDDAIIAGNPHKALAPMACKERLCNASAEILSIAQFMEKNQ